MEAFVSGVSIKSAEFDEQRESQYRLSELISNFNEKSNLVDFLFAVAQALKFD
jgi:hypothetical protein